MDKKNSHFNRRLIRTREGLTPQARAAIDNERDKIFRETGILKPRYEIASTIIINALGASGGGSGQTEQGGNYG
jgi:hypothetical protein